MESERIPDIDIEEIPRHGIKMKAVSSLDAPRSTPQPRKSDEDQK